MIEELTIEEKKIIAEKVKGWESYAYTGGSLVFRTKEGMNIGDSNFNPDQDLTQFVAMIGALDRKQREDLDFRLMEDSAYYDELDCYEFSEGFIWLCKHKYEVCKDVIEVVK